MVWLVVCKNVLTDSLILKLREILIPETFIDPMLSSALRGGQRSIECDLICQHDKAAPHGEKNLKRGVKIATFDLLTRLNDQHTDTS